MIWAGLVVGLCAGIPLGMLLFWQFFVVDISELSESEPTMILPDLEPADMVNHPAHYRAENGLEVIDVIEAFTAGLTGIEATDTGNIIKYACRWKEKNGAEDLRKLVWYANHLINHLEEESKS